MSAANGKVYQFKLVLLGESAVGKSSLVLRFVRGQFFDYQESTIGGLYSWHLFQYPMHVYEFLLLQVILSLPGI